MPAPNQTQSFLMRRFQQVGIRPKTQHGQNFLIDLNLLRLLLDSAQLGPNDVVLEVGTGTGSLTGLMAPRAAHVISVEIDPQMHQLASEELFEQPNMTLLLGDALRNKNSLSPRLMDALREQLAIAPERRLKLVANLPFAIATPLISNLLAADLVPSSMTVTIQKELADRITAGPGSKDYGALSVWVQSQCRAEVIRLMPPTSFWPQPKVTSAILRITLCPELRARIPDLAFFHTSVRALFFHRRKFLRTVVASAFKGRMTRADIDDVMAQRDLGPTARAEELDVEAMLALCETLRLKLLSLQVCH